jgi:hypothetical protein
MMNTGAGSTYYIAVAGWDTTFGNFGWSASSASTNAGSYALNIVAVPEPGSIGLLALGLGTLGTVAVRRRKNSEKIIYKT